MLISIIIPHFNDELRLIKCLESLLPQLADDCEIIVIDNNSPTRPKLPNELLKQISFAVEIEKGAGPARNKGVQLAKGNHLLFLDSDCIPADNWLTHAKTICNDDFVYGGKVEVFNETVGPMSGAEAFEHVFAFNQELYIKKKHFSVTANLLTSRAIFDKVGAFKPEVSEDTEWCHRLHNHNIQLKYDDKLVVFHPTRSNWLALKTKWRRITNESYSLTKNVPLYRLKWFLRAFLVLISGILHIPKTLLSKKLSSHRDKYLAIITLVRIRALRFVWMLKQSIT